MLRIANAPLSSFMDSTMNPKVNNGRRRSWGASPGSQHFEGRNACLLELQDGTRKIDKQFNHSHRLAQTKQQVG